MARKKIVFVIVEGPSDDEALAVLLDRIYDNNSVYVYIAHCDLTTEMDASGNYVRGYSILNKVGGIVKEYMNRSHLSKTHFREIVHIIDMDGAYIPDEAIQQSDEADKPIYSQSTIYTDNVMSIKKRNEQKRGCIDKLSSTPSVCGISYQSYYMSCNLDHVLYDKLNLTDDEKEKEATQFAKAYKDDIPGFIHFISNSDFSVTSGYLESWAFIKSEKHSLERHTNFGICVQRALDGNNA